ncbi:S8 family serine peptidase [Pseudomonas sp. MAFF 302030]|uniref:S8 family serine peptidase n=1 Tax=Pseudomonas morbosilactucae TaxID=2938197 RepID=A0A9X1Z4Z0_9PSED|nr:S8 family serine peptidase [Pseudomonas morbosilactucae]MCK9801385.1 S8 family serine peptidase [Pseudomonas morbosilactucae]
MGVIDSGGPLAEIEGALAFRADGTVGTCVPDRLGHGTVIASVIRDSCPHVVITHAQVFDERPVTTALQVALALDWFTSQPPVQRVDIVCMSLGLAADRALLREAIYRANAQKILIVAASPARGVACYPAGYDGVIGGTGDSRCKWEELSRLGPRLFGAWSNSPEQGGEGMAGASLGAARVAGHLAKVILEEGRGLEFNVALSLLGRRCHYVGREKYIS